MSVRDPDKWYDSYVASLLWLYQTWWFKPISWCFPMGWKLQVFIPPSLVKIGGSGCWRWGFLGLSKLRETDPMQTHVCGRAADQGWRHENGMDVAACEVGCLRLSRD